jgi:hypothetical protein
MKETDGRRQFDVGSRQPPIKAGGDYTQRLPGAKQLARKETSALPPPEPNPFQMGWGSVRQPNQV